MGTQQELQPLMIEGGTYETKQKLQVTCCKSHHAFHQCLQFSRAGSCTITYSSDSHAGCFSQPEIQLWRLCLILKHTKIRFFGSHPKFHNCQAVMIRA